jgi:hypothetical protein
VRARTYSLAALALVSAGMLSACRTTTTQVPAYAFGLTLGEVLDKKTAQPMDALIAGRALYRVRPPSPHRAMSDYALVTERDSGAIVGVVGWDRYSDSDACQAERTALAKVLERRFGPGRVAQAPDREQMRGLPGTLVAGDLTVYAGWQGPVALGCAGPRLLLGYWFVKPAPAEPAAPGSSAGKQSG